MCVRRDLARIDTTLLKHSLHLDMCVARGIKPHYVDMNDVLIALKHSNLTTLNKSPHTQSSVCVHTHAMHTHLECELLAVIIIAGQACTRVLGESVQVARKHTHTHTLSTGSGVCV